MRQLVKTIYPDGSESASTYDNSGNRISATDAAGGKATASYDGRGHLTATTDELGNQTAYEYDLNGNLIAQTLATGDVIRYTYDVRGRLQTMEAAGESIRYEYDAAGNVTRTVAGDVEARRRYDSMSRIVYELDENGENAQYRYDLAGNAVWISNSYGETVNEFDANGNLVTVKDAQTGAVKFRYERDALGNKTAVYLADGSMIRYDYDELGAYLGYEFVEPGRQPHGTVPGANYKPSRLVPPAEETKNWKKTDAQKEADKQIQKAKFAEYAAEVAYVEAEAMAPGSAQAKSAKAAYAQTKKAVDAAYAAKDAIADAKTQTGINRAVTSAQIAAGTAGRTADMVCLWEGSVASAKQTAKAGQSYGPSKKMNKPAVISPEIVLSSCSEYKYYGLTPVEADFVAKYKSILKENYDFDRDMYDSVTVTDVNEEIQKRRSVVLTLATIDAGLAFPTSGFVTAISGLVSVGSALDLIGKEYPQTYRIQRTQYYDWWEFEKDENGSHLASATLVEIYVIVDGEMHFSFDSYYTYYFFGLPYLA